MKKIVWLCLAALVCALNAFALGEVETAGGARITPANGSTFYNPTGITIGNYLYVYMQGSDPSAQEASCPGATRSLPTALSSPTACRARSSALGASLRA